MNKDYVEQMKQLLGQEYEAYEKCFSKPAYKGFRINRLKITDDSFFSLTNFQREKTPFCDNGYYYKENHSIGSTIAYAAGLLYPQEPSASCAVTALDAKQGMMVLDMCAAPGSKTTQILEQLQQTGFCVANEIHSQRANILKENVERCGAANCLILNNTPSEVSQAFPETFDAVLCDAPCSGEGMFRKEPQAEKDWSLSHVKECAIRQLKILEDCYKCLKPTGVLVYSTCTLNKEENEKVIEQFCKNHLDMQIDEIPALFGRPGFPTSVPTEKARRVFPMDKGEGHFVCRMIKQGTCEAPSFQYLHSLDLPKQAQDFLNQQLSKSYPYLLFTHNRLYGGTFPFIEPKGCHMIRHQVYLGEMKKDRFEPSHGFYTSAYTTFEEKVELSTQEVTDYLKGLTIVKDCKKGYCSIQWKGNSIGGAKSDGKVLKNRYPKEVRL